jgi:uncharacterized protein YjiS (DUF1127 family)
MKAHLTTTSSLHDTAGTAGTIKAWMLSRVLHMRRASADRGLRRQLAEMDDMMLRDIGISEDEIWRVRAQQKFTPRGWN